MIGRTLRAFRSFPATVQRLIAVQALMSFTVDGVFPVIFNLYILRLGFGPDVVGLVNSVALLVYAVASLAASTASAWLGIRLTLILSTALAALTTLALGTTDLLPTAWQPMWLTVMFSANYVGVAFYYVNSSPTALNLTPHAQRPRLVSLQNALGNFLSFVGGPMAGFVPVLLAVTLGWSLAEPAAYRVPLLIAGLVFVVGLVIIRRVRIDEGASVAHHEPSPERGAPTVAIAFGGTLAMIAAIRTLHVAGAAAGVTFFNVYMDDALGVSPQIIGMVVAAARLLSVFTALAVPRIVKRMGASNAALSGVLISVAALLPLALIPNWIAGSTGLITLHGATSIRYASFFVYSMAITPSRLRTRVAGVSEFSGGMTFALLSYVGGLMIVRWGYSELFLLAAAMTFAGALLHWAFERRRSRQASALPATPPAGLSLEEVESASVLPGTPLHDVPPAAFAPIALSNTDEEV